ncbi:MAG: hypothetical protein WA843_00640 [Candidatus Saccharimonadales bacterium]
MSHDLEKPTGVLPDITPGPGAPGLAGGRLGEWFGQHLFGRHDPRHPQQAVPSRTKISVGDVLPPLPPLSPPKERIEITEQDLGGDTRPSTPAAPDETQVKRLARQQPPSGTTPPSFLPPAA